MKRNTAYLIAAFLVILVLTAVLAFGAGEPDPNNGVTQPTPPMVNDQTTPTPTPDQDPNAVTPTPAQEGWQMYQSTQHNFRIQHPPQMQIGSTARGGVELMLTGPTQDPATDLFDGIRLTFLFVETDDDLESAAESRRQEQQQQPPTQNITQLKKTTINENLAYKHTLTGPFGDVKYLFLEVGENGYLEISQVVHDPEEQGFIELKEQILDTLVIM